MVKRDVNIETFGPGGRVVTKSSGETEKLAGDFISELVVNGGPIIVALTGDLGSGKTTFTKGLAKGLGIKSEIISPTFILVRTYEIGLDKTNKKPENLYHIDLYRLEGSIESEVENIGLKDILADSSNVVVIEWAEKIKELLPEESIWIRFEYKGVGERQIELVGKSL
jgi:tRNA threonylcarbamoyladenosine biosynthesis protein TsaE